MRSLLVGVLLLAGCSTVPPSIEPAPPLVRCRQPVPERTPPAPRADAWVEDAQGAARLSEAAVLWIRAVLGLREADGAQAAAQEACLSALEKAKHIRR